MKYALATEAVHSVAMEHERDCDCTVCRAADGDIAAFRKIMEAIDSA
jgi:hypothetical protein